MKRNYQRFCDWVFIRSPSLMLRNAISGGCKYGYKGFGRLCRSCENCIEPIFETKEEGGIHVAGGLRYQSGREMPPGMQELYGVQLAEQISKAPPVAGASESNNVPCDAEAEDLPGCPFCGSESFFVDRDSEGWYVECNACLAEGPRAETQAEAERNWSRRK